MLSVERIERIGESVILYDGSLVNHMREAWFDPATWAGAPRAPGYSGGRGATLFITCEGQDWVLRHYHRGGTVARMPATASSGSARHAARSFAEWRLLARHPRGGPARRRARWRRATCAAGCSTGRSHHRADSRRRAVVHAPGAWLRCRRCRLAAGRRVHRAGFTRLASSMPISLRTTCRSTAATRSSCWISIAAASCRAAAPGSSAISSACTDR